jgi:hypothetical protein
MTVDGTVVAGQLSLDALSDSDSPSIFPIEHSDGSTSEIRIFARELPELGESEVQPEAIDPALIEQLKALGYTID